MHGGKLSYTRQAGQVCCSIQSLTWRMLRLISRLMWLHQPVTSCSSVQAAGVQAAAETCESSVSHLVTRPTKDWVCQIADDDIKSARIVLQLLSGIINDQLKALVSKGILVGCQVLSTEVADNLQTTGTVLN